MIMITTMIIKTMTIIITIITTAEQQQQQEQHCQHSKCSLIFSHINLLFFLQHLGVLDSKNKGPGSLQHRGGKCIHVYGGAWNKPVAGTRIVFYTGCAQIRLEFQIQPDGKLIHTKYGQCLKSVGPAINGAKVRACVPLCLCLCLCLCVSHPS